MSGSQDELEQQGASQVAEDKPEANEPRVIEGDAEVEREMRRKSRRSFIVGGVVTLAAIGGWEWLKTRSIEDGTPWPLRRGLEFNEQLARGYFNPSREAQTFPREVDRIPRINGDIGLGDDFDSATWKLNVIGLDNPGSVSAAVVENKSGNPAGAETNREGAAIQLTFDDIKKLPRVELMTQLKCIEGWADMGFWAGARLIDFMEKYPPMTRDGNSPDVRNRPDDLVRYVSLATPDNGYYVGLDMASALHPQTLLVYEMGGKPLTLEHGAPLRLYIPVKYGIKSLKRIGTIRFTDKRPADYWAEQGYDWYAGH